MKNYKAYLWTAAWLALVLLLVPALWYSLRTSFGLIDDYDLWIVIQPFSHLSGWGQWLHETWFDTQGIFRITNDFYQALTWSLLRDNSGLHHAMRWVLKAIVVWCSFDILRLMAPSKQSASGFSFWVFCAIFVFFPDVPEARLGTAEPMTVVFLALMLNGLCRLCVHAGGDLGKLSLKGYLWLLFAFTGVLWSKEPNIVIGFVTFGTLICLNLRRWGRLVPLAMVVLVTALRVWAKKMAGGNGVVPTTWELVHNNIIGYTKGLFLSDTSVVCTLLLAVPSLIGIVWLVVQSWKTRSKIKDHPVLIFSWLVFLNMLAFYAIIILSWATVIRYFYPLVYLLTLWTAMALLRIEVLSNGWRLAMTGILIAASVYFIGVNYYNFIYQFACQYYRCETEHDVLQTIDGLLKNGSTVALTLDEEYEANIKNYFNDYLPYYKKTAYRVTVLPAQVPEDNSYFVTRQMQPLPAAFDWYRQFYRCHVSRILWACDRISTWLQFGRQAFYWTDAGAASIGRHGEEIRIWYIYNCRDAASCSNK